MKKCSLFILAFIAFLFFFGKKIPHVREKANKGCLVSKQLSNNLTSNSKQTDSELELISNQISNRTQANNRTHSLCEHLTSESLRLDNNVAFTNGIKKGVNNLSHKSYLLHNYPSHNFW
jgi:Sec-independent protein translocase protein TatA